MWSLWLVFCDCHFHSVCPLMDKDKRLMETFWWERLTVGESGSCSDGQAMLSKSLIQFSFNGPGCVPSLLFDLRPIYGGVNEDTGDLLQKVPCMHCPGPCSRPPSTHAFPGDSWTLTGRSESVSCGSLLLSPGSWCTQVLLLPSKSLFQLWNWTGVSCIAGRFFSSWATREAQGGLIVVS